MLLPALASARDSARLAACKSNLHQFGIASWIYIADFASLPMSGHSARYPTEPKLFIGVATQCPLGEEFYNFAKDYLKCSNPDTNQHYSGYGVLNCPGRSMKGTLIGWNWLRNASYVNAEIVSCWQATYTDPGNTFTPRVEPVMGSQLEKIYGPANGYWNEALRPQLCANAGAYPLLYDEALVYGDVENVSANGSDTATNHGTLASPKLNILYFDGSVVTQRGDPCWVGDCYGMVRGPSATFPSWYMPYIRMAPFPE